MSTVKDIINSMQKKDVVATREHVNGVLMDRIASAFDTKRDAIAAGLFGEEAETEEVKEEAEELEEAKKKVDTKDIDGKDDDNKEDDGKGLDKVGDEDSDVDNDGDSDESDEYLKNRRKKISKEMDKDEK